MIAYLQKHYTGPWSRWKLYSVPAGIPAHNNGLEGMNGGFKINGTCRERADLGTFCQSVNDWIYLESVNTEALPTTPDVPPSTWREGQLLEQGRNSRVDYSLRASYVLHAARIQFPELQDAWLMPTFDLVQKLNGATAVAKKRQLLAFAVKFVTMLSDPSRFTTFGSLLNTWKSFYVLAPKSLSSLIHFSCSCDKYWRHLQCPHTLAMGIRNNYVQIPDERSLRVLGRKKRSAGGRYALARSRLERQDEDDDANAGTTFASSQASDPCCFNCGRRNSTTKNRIVFCDGCDLGYHQLCVAPPLKNVPVGRWFCNPECAHLAARLDTIVEPED